jgi:putative oxidoreductase
MNRPAKASPGHAGLDQASCLASTRAGIGLLLLRVVAGGFLLPHGLGKLFGWFGGPGLSGFSAELQSFGLGAFAQTPIPLMLALIQTGVGVLVLAGAWTRMAACIGAAFLATTAALTAAASPAWFWMNHGIEYPLFWTLILIAIAMLGPGILSLDHGRERRKLTPEQPSRS